MSQASCLCGKIKFEIKGRPSHFNLCYCKMCQKFHGAPFGPYIRYKKDNFKVISGKKFEKKFQSSEWASRTFCSNCGSSLRYIFHKDTTSVYICAGIFDEKINIKPQKHIFVKSKCNWYKILDSRPQIDSYK